MNNLSEHNKQAPLGCKCAGDNHSTQGTLSNSELLQCTNNDRQKHAHAWDQ